MSSYIFLNFRSVGRENYKGLPDIFQKEMLTISKFDTGYNNGSIDNFMKACEAEFPNDAAWELWDIAAEEQPGKALYHFWRYFDEYGSLFHADTGEDVGIGMLNFEFMLHDGTQESALLSGALQHAFDNRGIVK